MKERFIASYVDRLTKEDILSFASANKISLSDEELEVLYDALKKNWKVILYGNPTPIFNELKSHLSVTTFEQGIELFYTMKQKYQSFL